MVANLGIFSESCKYFSKKLQILNVFPNMSRFLYLCNAKLRLISIEMISLTINNNEIANTINDKIDEIKSKLPYEYKAPYKL